MELLYNVTDAVGSASNHGITRTERQIAAGLAADPRVRYVVMRGGRLRTVPTDEVLRRLQPVQVERVPRVEMFGTGRGIASAAPGVGSIVRQIAARPAPVEDPLRGVDLSPAELGPSSCLVSVGLDWVHGTLDEAERLVFGHGGRFVGLCYDTIPIDHPEWVYPPDPDGFRHHISRLSRVSAPVMCISRRTQADLLRHVPSLRAEDAPVIRLGADAAIAAGAAELAWVDGVIGGSPYAVYCATIDRRKNHAVLYRAMKEMLRRGIEGNLVFVGMIGSGVEDLVDAMRHDTSIAGRIIHVANCDDAHLAALYRRAAFAVYPSLYEGWGLGVTEALAHGKPCIVASGSSLEEAGMGACPVVHPLRTGEWVDAMTRQFLEPQPPALIELPSWRHTATDVLGCVAQ